MEEQEKIDIRNHLIGWIDHFLEEGIVPQVVNPKAIRSNYILKSKVKEKIEELSNEEDTKYTWTKTNRIIFKEDIIDILQELLKDGD